MEEERKESKTIEKSSTEKGNTVFLSVGLVYAIMLFGWLTFNGISKLIATGFDGSMNGYELISENLGNWESFRNFGYVVTIIEPLVVFLFSLIPGKKVKTRAEVTAFNYIPRVILALIYLTFSVSISGLFLDFVMVAQRILSL